MSQENVKAFKRTIEELTARTSKHCWRKSTPRWGGLHPAFHVALGGEATVYRGHEGLRKVFQDPEATGGDSKEGVCVIASI